MKNIIKFSKILTTIILTTIVFYGCKELKTLDPAKGLKLILNYKPADAFIEVQAKDAKTGELITSKINIEILGKETANIINFEGESKAAYTKVGPSVYLGLRNVIPTKEKPVAFKVIIGAEGYLSGSKEITMIESSNEPVEIFMVKASSPPEGVTVQQAAVTSNATTGLTADKNIEVKNGQSTTIVEIDKGTVVQDSKGTTLTGNLQTTVVAFSGETAGSVNSFPGGSTTTLTKDPTGDTNVEAVLSPINFVEVVIKDANGNSVTKFSKPIDITFEINPETVNPATEEIAKLGDSFSIFSYSNATAAWTYEKEGTVIQKGNELFVTFQTDHLSWFSILRWFRFIPRKTPTPVYVPPTKSFNVTIAFDQPVSFGSFSANTQIESNPFYAGGPFINYSFGANFIKVGGSNEYRATITVANNSQKAIVNAVVNGIVQEFRISSLANNGSYRFGFSLGSNKQKTVLATVACENNCPLEIKPYNIGIQGKLSSASAWSFIGNVNYDAADNQIKLKAFVPDNTNITFRAVAYPEYTKVVNTGVTDSFTVPILLTKSHPLCKCGK